MKSVRVRWMSVALLCLAAVASSTCGGVGGGQEDYTAKDDDSLCSYHYCPSGYQRRYDPAEGSSCELTRTLTSCTTVADCTATDATYQCADDVCIKSTECFTNAHCAAGEFCKYWEDPEPACMSANELDMVCGGDTLPGTCTALPTACDPAAPGAVLIGCDGLLYASTCGAHLAGTSVSHLSVD